MKSRASLSSSTSNSSSSPSSRPSSNSMSGREYGINARETMPARERALNSMEITRDSLLSTTATSTSITPLFMIQGNGTSGPRQQSRENGSAGGSGSYRSSQRSAHYLNEKDRQEYNRVAPPPLLPPLLTSTATTTTTTTSPPQFSPTSPYTSTSQNDSARSRSASPPTFITSHNNTSSISEDELVNQQPLSFDISPAISLRRPKSAIGGRPLTSSRIPSLSHQPSISNASTPSTDTSIASNSSTIFRHRVMVHVDPADRNAAAEIFSSHISSDSNLIAVGCGDGVCRVYTTAGKLINKFERLIEDPMPCTSVRFKPYSTMLLTTNADGTINQYDTTSNSSTPMHSIVEAKNQLYTSAYAMDGKCFAAAGQSGVINVYDDETKSITLQCRGDTRRIGHTSRIYAVRFHPDNPSTLISGGWDNTVLVWDLRTGGTVRTIYGPHICGEAIDIHPFSHTLLTGSWQPKDALQTWDLSTGKLIETIAYNTKDEDTHQPNDMLYTCAYSADGKWLAAGGCGYNDAKLMPLSTPATDAQTPAMNSWVDRISLRGGVYSVCFSPNGQKLIVGGSDVNFTIIDL